MSEELNKIKIELGKCNIDEIIEMHKYCSNRIIQFKKTKCIVAWCNNEATNFRLTKNGNISHQYCDNCYPEMVGVADSHNMTGSRWVKK